MALRDLSLADWAHLSDEVARRECEQLARKLPHDLKLSNLKEHSYCGRTHRVARFSCREAGDLANFMLVPGGEVSLGFDGWTFKPQPWQVASYRGWPEEQLKRGWDVKYVRFSIKDFVDLETSPPRTVHLSAVLMEVEAREILRRDNLIELDSNDPDYKKYLKDFDDPQFHKAHHYRNHKVESYTGHPRDARHLVDYFSKTGLRVWRIPITSIRHVEKQLAKSGMRLPTSDEWEHACGAGAKTLFRWGDDTPNDFYPDDTCAEDRELKRASALSLGKLRYETPPPGWDLHDQLNLFGLRIAKNPYEMEIVSDEPWELGGDGGNYICGASSIFLGWLPLATAYRCFARATRFSPETWNVADEYHRLRRIIPIE